MTGGLEGLAGPESRKEPGIDAFAVRNFFSTVPSRRSEGGLARATRFRGALTAALRGFLAAFGLLGAFADRLESEATTVFTIAPLIARWMDLVAERALAERVRRVARRIALANLNLIGLPFGSQTAANAVNDRPRQDMGSESHETRQLPHRRRVFVAVQHSDAPVSHASTLSHGASGGGAYGFVRDGYAKAEVDDLTTADVESVTIYGRNDEKIGSVSSLKVDTDGKITDAVVDVGGFLGIGAHSVVIPFSDLTVLRETNGSDVRVHMDSTKDGLKAMPHHDG